MWSLALLGLVEVVAFALFDWEGYLRSSMSVSAASNPLSQFTPEYLLLMSVELLCWLAGVGLALGDWLALRRRGVPKPFHFAWVFLQSPWVYVIGRSVIVRRRVGFGMAPMWIFLLVQALMLVVVFAGMIPAMMSLFATLPYYSY
jgi:hypothetical protein